METLELLENVHSDRDLHFDLFRLSGSGSDLAAYVLWAVRYKPFVTATVF